jgi:hypothetical protein
MKQQNRKSVFDYPPMSKFWDISRSKYYLSLKIRLPHDIESWTKDRIRGIGTGLLQIVAKMLIQKVMILLN